MREHTRPIAGLQTTVVGDPTSARFVCVILHGFAMSPADLSPFAHALGLPGLFVFPEAPLPAILQPDEPHRAQGHAWWHIDPVARARALARGPRDFAGECPVDLPAARRMLIGFLGALAAEEVGAEGRGPAPGLEPEPGPGPGLEPEPGARLRPRPRFLAGFSQGGMLLADCFMRTPQALGATGLGFFSSSRIAVAEWPARPPARAGVGLPVFLSHGQSDPDLAFSAGQALRDLFVAAEAEATFVPFAGGHEIPLVVWRGFRRFLTSHTSHLPPAPAPAPAGLAPPGLIREG